MPDFKEGKLLDFFKFFQETPQKKEAVKRLEAALREKAPELLRDEAYWVQAWRTPTPVPSPKPQNPLPVKLLSQVDSVLPDQDIRTCFSSCVSMVINWHKPEIFKDTKGLQKDDYYVKFLLGEGKTSLGAERTTLPQAHVACLRRLGFKANFYTNGSWEAIRELIDAGLPAPCGVLHKGHYNSPYGGGHYVLPIGYTQNHVICNDPAGVMDCSGAGGYGAGWGVNGGGVAYNKQHWLSRWIVDGEAWYLDIRP